MNRRIDFGDGFSLWLHGVVGDEVISTDEGPIVRIYLPVPIMTQGQIVFPNEAQLNVTLMPMELTAEQSRIYLETVEPYSVGPPELARDS